MHPASQFTPVKKLSLSYNENESMNQKASAHKHSGAADGHRKWKECKADKESVISFAAYDSCYTVVLGPEWFGTTSNNISFTSVRDTNFCIF